jgi:cytochrome oxidase Cu insertion factor (SCO1/SenC/PrrC family)
MKLVYFFVIVFFTILFLLAYVLANNQTFNNDIVPLSMKFDIKFNYINENTKDLSDSDKHEYNSLLARGFAECQLVKGYTKKEIELLTDKRIKLLNVLCYPEIRNTSLDLQKQYEVSE